MAKPKQQIQIVVCEVCQKQILPEGNMQSPTDYVVYNGHNICWDCVKSGKEADYRQI